MIRLTYLILLSVLLCHNALAGKLANQLEHKLVGIRTMRASFTQKVYAGTRLTQQSSGRFALQRPKLFRWNMQKPSVQLLVADGKNLWIYNPGLKQVIVKSQKKGLQGTPAWFLSGYETKISSFFRVSQSKAPKGFASYVMRPLNRNKKDSFKYIQVVFQGNKLMQLRFKDALGNKTDIQFSSVKINSRLSRTLFRFSPPMDVDIEGRVTA